MIDNLLNILSVLVWGSIGFCLAFVLVRVSALIFHDLKDEKSSEPVQESPAAEAKLENPKKAKTPRPRRKKQSK